MMARAGEEVHVYYWTDHLGGYWEHQLTLYPPSRRLTSFIRAEGARPSRRSRATKRQTSAG